MLSSGQVIRAPELGLLATVGCVSDIRVRPGKTRVQKEPLPLVVGVLSSGNELVSAATPAPLPVGKIRDSNKCMLMALAKQMIGPTCSVVDLGAVRDEASEIDAAISEACASCDVLITSGGVSMGELDMIKPYIEQKGQVYFGRLNMKPGKPTTFGRIRDCLVLALPGNPVSCFVSASLFLRPMVHMLATGCRRENRIVRAQLLPRNVRVDPIRPEYHRCTVYRVAATNKLVAVSTGANL